MKTIIALCLALLVASCSHLGIKPPARSEAVELWNEAHLALARTNFANATDIFKILASEYAETDEGRESLFYLGVVKLDPRNPDWNPKPAEAALEQYLAADSMVYDVKRAPEGRTLLQLARQLNLPVAQRVEGLQPDPKVVTVTERVVVPASQSRELAAEVERLRAQLAQADSVVQQQKEELERIRKTLKGAGVG